ncbi:carbohydrate esterase family 4 protein [Lentinula aciculospora]|uniref:chitin deacetylase n=1 Tax=Lentinula aciculospora TaxID=153920 RepID=A0A9W9A3M7_9AGAR|nr:carbohydrate esterase family 4 protein [Lentinula aciculospora]
MLALYKHVSSSFLCRYSPSPGPLRRFVGILSSTMIQFPALFILLGLLLLANSAAVDRTSEEGEAAILDPNQECTPYNYATVTNQMNSFPQVWESASILSDDAAAFAKWSSISANIPTNIPQKTQPPPSSYSASDPDCWWTYGQCTTPKLADLPPDVAAASEPSTLGYGFDDGPNCSHNAFYDFLQGQNQKATFYFIGSNVADFPLEAQRALTDGHEICAHTWSHPYMTTFASEDMQMIKLVVGVTPTCWRPPYGDVDDRVRAIAHALGLQTIMWEYDTADASVDGKTITDQTVVDNYDSFIQKASSGAFNSTGAILLTHELNNFTMSEAVNFYPQLKNVFQHLVPVGVSLNKTQPYVESNYSLPTFEQYISGTLTGSRGSPNSTTALPSSTSTSLRPPSTSTANSAESSASKNSASSLVKTGYNQILLSASFAAICFHFFGTVDFLMI